MISNRSLDTGSRDPRALRTNTLSEAISTGSLAAKRAGLPHALQITGLRLAPSMDKVLREQHGSLMSYLSLYQQLSIEFLSDPEFDHGRARDDAFALCAHWRHTHGRHVPTEKISEEFGHWWRRHYTEGLRAAGPTRSYRAFLTHLSSTIDASKRY